MCIGDRPCPSGCGFVAGDDIRHLAECPLIFTAVLPITGMVNSWPCTPGLLSLFLLVPKDSIHEVVLSAALADTFVHCYLHFLRGSPSRVWWVCGAGVLGAGGLLVLGGAALLSCCHLAPQLCYSVVFTPPGSTSSCRVRTFFFLFETFVLFCRRTRYWLLDLQRAA